MGMDKLISRIYRKGICLVLLFAILFAPCPAGAVAGGAIAPSAPSPSASPAPPAPTPTQNPVYAEMLLKKGQTDDQVINLQSRLRDLGYFSFKLGDYFGDYTEKAVKDFQADNGLAADGVVGGMTAHMLYGNSAKRRINNNRIPTPTPRPTAKPSARPKYGKLVEWSRAKSFVPWSGGGRFACIDFNTGSPYNLIRVGGSNHMDVEPATAKDTATLKKCYGGRWSYARRPTLARFGGTWYATSINGQPHGKETVRNNDMTGQICLHFLNSRTHGTNIKDAQHQRCIKKAAGQ